MNDVCDITRPCGDGLSCSAGRCLPLQCVTEAFEAVSANFDVQGIADQLLTNDWLNNHAPEDVGKILLAQGPAALIEETFYSCSSRYPFGSGRRNLQKKGELTVYVGAAADGGVIGKGVASAGYAFQDIGVLVGSVNAFCWGVGLQVLLGAGLNVGMIFTDDVTKIPGNSQGGDLDIGIGVGTSVGVQVATDGTPTIEAAFGVGLGFNFGSYFNCETTFRAL